MPPIGDNGTLRVKREVPESKALARVQKLLRVYHQATAGATTIPLNTATLPDDMTSYVNPSASDIAGAEILVNKNAVTVASSIKGRMRPGSSYEGYSITGNSSITLQTPAEAGEVFEVSLDVHPKVGAPVTDFLEWATTYQLTAGQTDVPLGMPVPTAALPGSQIPRILVIKNGTSALLQNADNSSAGVGNYWLVDTNGVGYSSLLRLNDAAVDGDFIMVMPVGTWPFQRTDGISAVLQTLSSQVDAISAVLAPIADIPLTDLQAAPNYPDLAAFGADVQATKNFLRTGQYVVQEYYQEIVGYSRIAVSSVGYTTGNTAMPITDGDQIFAPFSFTPKYADSILEIEVLANIGTTRASVDNVLVAIFVDGVARGHAFNQNAPSRMATIRPSYRFVAGSTAAKSITVRGGGNSTAVETILNDITPTAGGSAAGSLGNAIKTWIRVREWRGLP